jgi:type I restriction enzyme S subunit
VTEENGSLSRLPIGWVWTEMQHISETTSGGTPSRIKKEYFGGNIPWLKSGELNNQVINSSEESITREGLENSSAKIVPKGALLIALYGATVGKLGILGIDAAINQAICAILPYEGISNKFLFWYLSQHRNELLNIRKGGAQPNISQDVVKHIPVPIAPFPEQCRTVARLEELFTRLDAGVDGLRKVKAQLKRYRQAVLKYAFEGKLTEEWRKTHKDQIEPATKLLEQISQENAVESNLPELPEGWIWTRLELVTTNHDGKRVPVSRKKRESMKGVYPYYGASGIIDSVDDYLFDGNFLLIGEDGANLLARATPIAYQATGKFWVNNHAHVLTSLGGVPISYLEHYINRISLAEYVTGTAQPKLTQRAMNKIPVPLAPLKEQYKIAEEINRRFSVIDEISKEMELMIRYSDRLRQSILKTAFEGKLVPQDPSDEPAEKLLERIKAERAKSKGEKDTNRKNKSQLELSTYVK